MQIVIKGDKWNVASPNYQDTVMIANAIRNKYGIAMSIYQKMGGDGPTFVAVPDVLDEHAYVFQEKPKFEVCDECGFEFDMETMKKGVCVECRQEWDDEPVYGPDGETLYDPWFEKQKVDRTCEGCGRKFRGMPDHGFCDSCADARERGWDIG